MKKKMVLTFVTAMMSVAVSMAGNKEMAEADGWEHAQQVEALIHAPQFKSHTYNICDYHHAGDSLYTDAINQAIVKCSNDGGGTVLIPDGDWYTGPIRLRSHVNLHLSDHATLHFITDMWQRQVPILPEDQVLRQRGMWQRIWEKPLI